MKIECRVFKESQGKSEVLVVGCFEENKGHLVRSAVLDRAAKKEIEKALSSKKFEAKADEGFFLPAPFLKSAGSVFVVGLGKKEKYTLERVRRAAAKALSQAKAMRASSMRFDLESFFEKFSLGELAGAAVEGARLAGYRFERYKSKPNSKQTLKEAELVFAGEKNLPVVGKAVREAEIVSEAVCFARDLANEPANVMTPAHLAEAAKKMASANGLACRILGKEEIKRLGMGGVLAVSQGSVNPPRFVILENKVPKRVHPKPLVLVGKGITFDTGGISIKPSNDMDKMKFDMCGAAAVMGAMKAIADLKLPVKVVGLTPLCENMPGSTAQRPGDIIRCLNGKTVEVLNTDAEGRLILADALSYAARYKPMALVDIATLTGACAVTFGDVVSGLMGTDASFLERVRKAGEKAGERFWELPLYEEYGEFIRGTYADIQNISKKSAGTITAGMFLKEFADHASSWAHLDVAGTAWADSAKPLSPVGATGVGVRLFVELVKSYIE
ncbi:MAG: leucyl aminopeptidase [Candidatus Omnitrophica bacterium]|nr:leucyl aminopeptidase [Candidatus Omnitrophota bacterium]